MTTKRQKPKTRPLLSADDLALWRHTTDSVTPLERNETVLEHDEFASNEHNSKVSAPPASKPATRPTEAAAPSLPPAKSPRHNRHLPQVELNRRQTRKLGSGHVEIGARIDLHGMRQSEAHGALRAFLLRAQARGHKWVLVITGKGSARVADEDTPWNRDGERGVLKRNVPRWLAEPDLRSVVVGYASAAVAHGGTGALYVQLRRRRPVQP